jgi:hypothetical protein
MQIVQSAYTFIEAKIDKIQNKIASKQHIKKEVLALSTAFFILIGKYYQYLYFLE